MQYVELLDTPAGHLLCTLVIFFIGALLYACRLDYGKEIIAGALGSLWTLLQVRRIAGSNIAPGVVNQAETITVNSPQEH